MSLLRTLREFWSRNASSSDGRRRVKSHPRSRIARLEHLEDRAMLSVDLVGTEMTVLEWLDDPYVPGDAVGGQWQIANQGFDTAWSAFDVQFYLSRDPYVTSSTDYLLKWRRFPPGFPGLYAYPVVNDVFYLPPASHPIWAGSGVYFIGMLIDPWNEVPESNEWNNGGIPDVGNTAAVWIQADPTPPVITDLDQLPETGVAPGAVLNGAITGLRARLKEAAASQAAMHKLLKNIGVAVPTVKSELRSLSSSIAAISKKLSMLINGKSTSVTLAPGVVFDRSSLDLTERYLKYIFSHDESCNSGPQAVVPSSSAPSETASRGEVLAPQATDFDPKKLIPGYETYEKAKKWVDDVGKKISDTVEALKKAANNAIKWLGGLFGQSAETQARAQQEAKAVAEGGSSLADRVSDLEQQLTPQTTDDKIALINSLLTGAPKPFAIASSRLKTLMRKTQNSVQSLQTNLADIEAWAKGRALVGFWSGQYTNYRGDTEAMTLTIRVGKNGKAVAGSGNMDLPIYDPNTGNVIGTVPDHITLSGTYHRADGTVTGTLHSRRYKMKYNFSATLNVEGNRLSGQISKGNSVSTFRLDK